MARQPDVRVRPPGVGAEGAHGATVMARIAERTHWFKSNPIENSTPRWPVVGQPVAGACRVEQTRTAPPSDDQRERRASSRSGRLSPANPPIRLPAPIGSTPRPANTPVDLPAAS